MFFWLLLALLLGAAGARYLVRLRRGAASTRPGVDDEAVRRIIERGTFEEAEEDALDLEAAARAEEEFWNESWDEPEELGR